jgi:hypothetical protein
MCPRHMLTFVLRVRYIALTLYSAVNLSNEFLLHLLYSHGAALPIGQTHLAGAGDDACCRSIDGVVMVAEGRFVRGMLRLNVRG